MNINLDFWILRLSDINYYQRRHAFNETKKIEYMNIPSNITYNQVFKLLFLIRYVYDNVFDDGTIIIKKLTTEQISHILNYIFGYKILFKENIVNENENNRVKNISLSYLDDELSYLLSNSHNYDDENHFVKKNSFFGIDNIDEILDGDKYFYYRIQERTHPFVKVDGEKEPLIFRDVEKIKEAIKYVLKNIKHPENINIYDRILKKDVICFMKSLKGKKHYIVMDKGESKNFYNKVAYINILNNNKYRKEVSKVCDIKYPSYVPVNGNKNLEIEEIIFLLDKIYGYYELNENEIEILNKGAYKGYYGYIHPEVDIVFTGNLNKSIEALRYNVMDDYARPNVSKLILERQIELALESKKDHFYKKLQEIKASDEPERIITSVFPALVNK